MLDISAKVKSEYGDHLLVVSQGGTTKTVNMRSLHINERTYLKDNVRDTELVEGREDVQ